MKESVLKAYSEVDAIISSLEIEYLKKIPLKVRNLFKNHKLKEYKPELDINKPLSEQVLERDTLVFLAILYVNYLCENEAEKESLLKEFANNSKQKKLELREKFNPDNLFNKAKKSKTQEEKTDIIEYKKESFFRNLWHKFLKMFRKKR